MFLMKYFHVVIASGRIKENDYIRSNHNYPEITLR